MNEEDILLTDSSWDDVENTFKRETEKIEWKSVYKETIKILKKYIDLKEEYYPIIATWIMGTYAHKNFYTYPYLFFNAMRGSGKSRALKLIAYLSYKGDIIASLNEAVLFRSEVGTTFCVDEFESVGSKDKQALRELLNAAYKKGVKIKRMKEVKKLNPETGRPEKTFEVETFEPFRPIAMANIFGMEEILEDRCLTFVLEKSNNPEITNLLEIFDLDDDIQSLKVRLNQISVVWCSELCQKQYIYMVRNWNAYISSLHIIHITTLLHTTTTTTYNYIGKQLELFRKIKESGINSRSLEKAMPLIYLASLWGEETNIISVLKEMHELKKEDELFESRDVQVFEFVSQKDELIGIFIGMNELTKQFKIFFEGDVDESVKDKKKDWMNAWWLGKALKRLALVKKKRRIGRGIEVILDIEKAKNKSQMFHKREEKEEYQCSQCDLKVAKEDYNAEKNCCYLCAKEEKLAT